MSRLSLTRSTVRKHSCPVEEFPPTVERLKMHMKSPISFERQLARPDNNKINAHESRFMVINDNPAISSKFKRVVSPVFSKSPGRKSNVRDDLPTTEYAPKLDLVKDRAGSGSPKWKTKQGRKTSYAATTDVTYHVKYQTVDKQVPVPNFDKSVSRPQSTVGPLPSFMCSINSRQGVRQLNEKSLKMNKFTDWDFYLPESTFTFKASKTLKVEKTTKSRKNSPKDH